MASSTFFTAVRTRLSRFLLMIVRRAETRVAFFAELVFAIGYRTFKQHWPGRAEASRAHFNGGLV
jgi:hypothetical protein